MNTKVFEKFIFLSILVFFAAFYVQNGLEASREENETAKIEVKDDLSGSIGSLDREAERPLISRNGNVVGATSPLDKKLSFLRLKSTPPPQIPAQSFLIGDPTTGEIYLSEGAQGLWPMASISKLMSGVVVLDNLEMDSAVSIAAEDLINLDRRFVNIFKPGSTYSVKDLFNALLVPSSNEAAEALARHMGRANFIKAMNDKSSSWGLTSTFFKDPAGISASNQSSVTDLFRLTELIYKNYPDLIKTTAQTKAVITEQNSKTKYTVFHTHQFASRTEFLGGKTGTTPEASENLLTIISYGGRPLVIIVLGTQTRFEDTDKLIQWFKNDFSRGY